MVEVRNAGEGHARGVGVCAGLNRDLTLAEVSAQRRAETDDQRLELRLAIVQRHVCVADLEAAEADRERLRCLRWLRRGFLRDVPVGTAILESDERESRAVELHGADDERFAAHHVPQHADEVEDDPEVTNRGERVVLEAPRANRREVVEREGEMREAPEEGQADVSPVDACVDIPIYLQLCALRDAIAEEKGRDDEQHEHESDQRCKRGKDFRTTIHYLISSTEHGRHRANGEYVGHVMMISTARQHRTRCRRQAVFSGCARVLLAFR